MGSQPPNYPPPGGYQPGGYQPGGYPPGGGGVPPGGKTQVLGLDYNIAGLLCYLPVCCINVIGSILFLVTEPKENKFVRFHAIQSLLLMVVTIVVFGIFWGISFFLAVGSAATGSAAGSMAGSGIAIIFSLIGWAVLGIYVIVSIIGCVKAYQNQMWQMPMIGGFADSKS